MPLRRTHARHRPLMTATILALVVVTAACGDKDDDTQAAAQSGPTVEIDTFMFSPDPLEVQVGDTVTWTNRDDILHTITSGTRVYDPDNSGLVVETNKDGLFDEQLDGPGATGEFTFSELGTFHYFCDRHPGMEADIEVK